MGIISNLVTDVATGALGGTIKKAIEKTKTGSTSSGSSGSSSSSGSVASSTSNSLGGASSNEPLVTKTLDFKNYNKPITTITEEIPQQQYQQNFDPTDYINQMKEAAKTEGPFENPSLVDDREHDNEAIQ